MAAPNKQSMIARQASCILAAGLLLGAPVTHAQLPEALICTFNEGGAWAYEKQAFVTKSVDALKLSIVDIDRAALTARLDRTEGVVVLRMVQAVDAHHFIEVSVEGFLNLTTVYDRQADGGFPAVHSRHVAVLGEPLVSQYRGTCKPKT